MKKQQEPNLTLPYILSTCLRPPGATGLPVLGRTARVTRVSRGSMPLPYNLPATRGCLPSGRATPRNEGLL